MAKGSIQLDGVIIRGETRKAILKVNPGLLKDQKNKTNPFVTLGLNEQIGEYRIEKIEPRGITLESRGTTLEIPLFAAGKAAAPATSAAQTPGSVTIMSPTAPAQPGQAAPGQVQPKIPPQVQPPAQAQGRRRRPLHHRINRKISHRSSRPMSHGRTPPIRAEQSSALPPFPPPRRWTNLPRMWMMARIQPRTRNDLCMLGAARAEGGKSCSQADNQW